jgi:hypothetical protein
MPPRASEMTKLDSPQRPRAAKAEQTGESTITQRHTSAESLKTTKVLDPSPEDPRPAVDGAGKEADPDSAT